MPTEVEYRDSIQRLDWDGLATLWQSVLDGDTPAWAPGKALEYLVLRAFELEGADIRWPYEVELAGERVEQVDGAVYAAGLASLIECKDQRKSANVEPIAKLRNQLLRRPSATIGVVISMGGFTEAASILAGFLAPQTVLLWGGEELGYALQKHLMTETLVTKYRRCVEEGTPDFNIMSEEVP